MAELTSTEVVQKFHPDLTARKLELWVKDELVRPRLGGRGRKQGHKFPPREVRRIELMIGRMKSAGLSAEVASAVADRELVNEERPTILAVEPDVLQQRLLSAFLSNAYKIRFVNSAQRAVGLLRRLQGDSLPENERAKLVILEPRLDPAAARTLILEAAKHEIPVIVTTSGVTLDFSGGDPTRVLTKPFPLSQLAKKASELLPADTDEPNPEAQ